VIDSLPCTILGSATKRLKESDMSCLNLVTTSVDILFQKKEFENANPTVWKSKKQQML